MGVSENSDNNIPAPRPIFMRALEAAIAGLALISIVAEILSK